MHTLRYLFFFIKIIGGLLTPAPPLHQDIIQYVVQNNKNKNVSVCTDWITRANLIKDKDMIDINNTPSVFNESGRKPKFVGINALKDLHLSFSGYGIATGEKVTFPTAADLEKNPTKYFKVLDTYVGSPNKSGLVLVERTNAAGKKFTDWFNLSTLSRQATEEDGTRIDIDDFRAEMRTMHDDAERVTSLLGKTIVGGEIAHLFGPKFDRETRKPTGDYIPADYVTISIEKKSK